MLYHGSVSGAFSLKDSVLETLQCMRRAGKQHCNVKIFMCQMNVNYMMRIYPAFALAKNYVL